MDRCWICGKKSRDESVSCGRLACLMELDDMDAEEVNHEQRQIRLGMWKALFSFMDTDRRSLFERWFYCVKLWMCGLLGWRSCLNYKQNPIDVANIDFHKTYAGWDWTWLRVGSGVFTNWTYELMHDSEWNM